MADQLPKYALTPRAQQCVAEAKLMLHTLTFGDSGAPASDGIKAGQLNQRTVYDWNISEREAKAAFAAALVKPYYDQCMGTAPLFVPASGAAVNQRR